MQHSITLLIESTCRRHLCVLTRLQLSCEQAKTCATWVDTFDTAITVTLLVAVILLVKLVEILPHQQLLTFTPKVWVLGDQIVGSSFILENSTQDL